MVRVISKNLFLQKISDKLWIIRESGKIGQCQKILISWTLKLKLINFRGTCKY